MKSEINNSTPIDSSSKKTDLEPKQTLPTLSGGPSIKPQDPNDKPSGITSEDVSSDPNIRKSIMSKKYKSSPVREPTKTILPAGAYWIGDIWSIRKSKEQISSERWGRGPIRFRNGTLAWVKNTGGDCTMYDPDGYVYAVETGSIGIIPIDQIDNSPEMARSLDWGRFVLFRKEFEVYKSGPWEYAFGPIRLTFRIPDGVIPRQPWIEPEFIAKAKAWEEQINREWRP